MPRVNMKTGRLIEREEFTGPNPEKQPQQYVERYLLKIRWNFDQTLKIEKCKSQN
uniref:Uncharacterized protein n=1 Tax=Candidatus Methanophagaceae archaeon ANME-1 ERB6 TaxID=2759912 RepID=A0A7G9YWM6_9EURY|nr:hypothetical protein IAKEDICC_00032 [Methanosarcinales archaeon ANME-1 ERB6]